MSTNNRPNITTNNRTTRSQNKRLLTEVNENIPAKKSVPKKAKGSKMSASESCESKNLIMKLVETNLCQRIDSSQNILDNSINDLSIKVNTEVQAFKTSVDIFITTKMI